MNRATEDKLLSLGCVIVLFANLVLAYMAINSSWNHLLTMAFLLVGYQLICLWRSKRDRRLHLAALEAAFASSDQALPHFQEGGSYSFRTFTLTFSSEADLKRAEESGAIATFKEAVQVLYGHTGSKSNPFDADRAVWATCEGWKERMVASMQRNSSTHSSNG